MSNDYLTRAQTLIEALPYIQKYNGKIVVIKYGGNAMISQELREAVMSDIILLSLVGVHVVVVHGGGPEISAMLKKIGSYAREDLEKFFGCRVNLQLWVKVKEDWRNRDALLRSFGYDKNSFEDPD